MDQPIDCDLDIDWHLRTVEDICMEVVQQAFDVIVIDHTGIETPPILDCRQARSPPFFASTKRQMLLQFRLCRVESGCGSLSASIPLFGRNDRAKSIVRHSADNRPFRSATGTQ